MSTRNTATPERRGPQRRWLLPVAILLATLLAAVSLPAQQPWRWPDADRIVAVADIHGAYDELVGLLQATGVVDDSLAWRGGSTHLVSLGDLLDRGADSRRVMDLLMRLQQDAPADGGAVHVVLGNHELMNLLGDLRYVSEAEYAAFAAEETEGLRASAYARFPAATDAITEPERRAAFDQRYPRGYFAHRLAFRPDGRYGEWLLSQPALVVVGDTAFVHGGLSELIAQEPPGQINRQIGEALRRYFTVRDDLVEAGVLPPLDMERDLELAQAVLQAAADRADAVDPAVRAAFEELIALNEIPALGVAGPLWYRGAVYCNPFIEAPVLDAALERLEAARVAVGHTVTEDRRVRSLYDGRLLMLDTGMLGSYYSGRPAALVIDGDETLVQYLDPDERRRPERSRLEAFGLTEAQIVAALAHGVIEPSESDRGSAPAVDVHHDGRTIQAVFYPQDRRGPADLELAAHRLDRLLGLHLVPATVERDVDGQRGALQLRYPDTISESERVESRLPAGTWCPIEPQYQLMYAFDLLTFNTGRSADSIVYHRDLSALKLIDHARTFGTERRPRIADGTLTPSAQLHEALASLSESQLEAALGAWLDNRQLRALLARRDLILEAGVEH